MRRIGLYIMTGMMLLLTGCASILSDSVYPLFISSSPSESSIVITDRRGVEVYAGKTPATVHLESGAGFFTKASYQIKYSLPGYATTVLPVTFRVDGWYFGNLLLCPIGGIGLIGMLIVDPATGSMWRPGSAYVHATLERGSRHTSLDIRHIDEIPLMLRSQLVELK